MNTARLRFRSLKFRSRLKGQGIQAIQICFALLCLVLVWWFFRHEKNELSHVPAMLGQAQPLWLNCGILLAISYIFIQALMYRTAFNATGANPQIIDMVVLFLKRNFISVFLPAGGISSLAFFGQPLEKKGISTNKIHVASVLYGFAGIVSIILVAIPVFMSAFFYISLGWTSWLALGLTIVLTIGLLLVYRSLRRGGPLKVWLENRVPALRMVLEEIALNRLDRKHVLMTIFYSILIEICGIAHLYIAIKALGAEPLLLATVIGYVVAVIFMLISPFLRGLGAVELSMAFLLTKFGYDQGTALSVTMLYRIFEFWFPLLAGLIAFILPWNRIILRIIPSALLLLSGIVDILSVLTPAITSRLVELKHFIPPSISHASNFLVFTTGIFMLSTGIFLMRAHRSAWIFACILSLVSIVGNLLKAYDYEEALLSTVVLIILLVTRKQYFVKGASLSHIRGNVVSLMICMIMIWAYGTIGFYFIDPIHFDRNFTLTESLSATISEFFLIDSAIGNADISGRFFLHSINLMGFTYFTFVLYVVLKSWLSRTKWGRNQSLDNASDFARTYGTSSMDYFKYYCDKQIFWSTNSKAFLAFRISGSFAIALEKPVAVNRTESILCIMEFEDYCRELGYSPIYYRVGEKDLDLFNKSKKKLFFLGQEAVVDLNKFSLDGKEKKSLRNAVNKLKSAGFTLSTHNPPQTTDMMDQLESVSDSWLTEDNRKELLFAEGMFIRDEIASHVVITLECNKEILAFLNVIPDHANNEGTYDLIRKKTDAPNGAMDGLLIELFHYFKDKGLQYVNLGMAPMSGLDKPSNIGEQVIKFAYEHASRYGHYKGLREFKEKYDPEWHNVYLLYTDDFQLLSIPKALKKVMNI